MSTRTMEPPGQSVSSVPDVPLWRMSVAQYQAMARAGVLTTDDQVELLEGWLVEKMTKNPPHRLVTHLLRREIERLINEVPSENISEGTDNLWYVDSQEPITTTDSEPEPDITVIRGTPRDYADHHPRATDTALIIEVADATLRHDRGIKKRLYARAAIPIYWIVDLNRQTVEVYTVPQAKQQPPDYQQQQTYTANDLVPLMLDGHTVGQIAVRNILP